MPIEAIFEGYTFKETKEYKGDNFTSYLAPNDYRPLTDFTGWGNFSEIAAEDRLIAITNPMPLTREGNFSQQQIRNGRVSPDPRKFGTYTKNTKFTQYYWAGDRQIEIVYELLFFEDIDKDQLSDKETRTLKESITLLLGQLIDKIQIPAPDLSENDGDMKWWQKLQNWAYENNVENVIGVWIETNRTVQPIESALGVDFGTGLFPNTNGIPKKGRGKSTKSDGLPLKGRGKSDGVQGQQDKKINPFPYIVSGVGIFTGSPLLIGSGLLLRFLEDRK